MDIEETKAARKIMKAYEKGATIEARYQLADGGDWAFVSHPKWDFYNKEYRISNDVPEAVEIYVGMEIMRDCLDAGLIINCTKGNTLRFLPAINVTPAEIDEGFAIFEKILEKHQ